SAGGSSSPTWPALLLRIRHWLTLLLGSSAAGRRRGCPAPRAWQPRHVPAQALVQVYDGSVQTLPRPRCPQIQRVARRTTSETVVDVLGQVHGKRPAGDRARAVQRARPTRLGAEHAPRLKADQLEHLGDTQPRFGFTEINPRHGNSPYGTEKRNP